MAGVQPQPTASLIELEKSPNDKRIYKAYHADNGLRVLLISDPETDKAAACMTVNVGSLCDPRQLPGLAHFCEHMLFLGTERFPIENTYSKFISEHGGQCNAATKPDETLYAFDINPANLEEALDIFSQFFISPLFTESAALREINAIHAEYEKNLTNDTRRLFQLERSLSLPGHEYSRFFSGNRISLFQSPCARSLNTREQLLEFYDQWYSANLMALVVLGKQSIDELKYCVDEKFKGIKNNKVTEPHWTNTPWPEAVLKKKIYMEPLSDTHQLHLQWPIPDYSENYKSQPAAYVTHLLGHEGRGSLLSLFKRMGWVNRLSCGVSRPGKGFASLFLSLDLTDTGLGHVSDIITRVYQYINLMCSHEPHEWIFRENQSLNDLQFRFKDKEPPYDYVIELGTNMLHYKLEDALTGPYLLDSFEPVLVKDILSCLHPENCRVFEVSKTFAPQCTDTERWYGTHFLCMNISDEDLQTWRDCGVDPHMVLPEPNKYIATDFTIEPPPDGPVAETPELLYANDIFRLWHIQDEEFLLPKGFITIHLISPLAFQSPLRTLLTALYVELFVDHISEDAYNCMLAGMNVDFKRTTQGAKLSLSGYTHKLGLLTRNVIDHLIHFLAPTPDRFRYLREEIGREIKNFDLKSPYQQAGIFLTNVLCDRSWTNEELATAFPDITYDVLLNFIPQFFASLSEETLIYGNVTTKVS
ncbi:Insulin-degrading enzyme [Fasciola gigantica]|uniref:Insulin-degrading enzyme n=1 Tax=Fasciola gigantica TaxID=46835 RepID=A0A504Z084_FASGI|nr:Insulin-degrading enzyme [Fasciola gigantica]